LHFVEKIFCRRNGLIQADLQNVTLLKISKLRAQAVQAILERRLQAAASANFPFVVREFGILQPASWFLRYFVVPSSVFS